MGLALLAACGSTEPRDSFVGSYHLATIEGQPLPHVQTVSDIRLTITDGLLIISPKGEWSMVTEYTRQIGAQPAESDAETAIGVWHAEGNTITLLSTDPPDVRTATYASGTIATNLEVYRAVYRRD